MAKLLVFVLLLLISLVAPKTSQAYIVSTEDTSDWKATLGLGKAKVTHLHFYFHDRVGGENATAIQVAKAPTVDTLPSRFGELVVADDPLTTDSDPNSKEVGRGQGIYGTVGLEKETVMMAFSFFFTEGMFNGSSLSMVSRNPIFMESPREMAIVGGTGKFQLARGIVMAKTVDVQGLSAIVEYDVTVVHYEIVKARTVEVQGLSAIVEYDVKVGHYG